MDISPREQKIIAIILENGSLQSSQVHAEIEKKGENVSLVTVKRALSEMVTRSLLVPSGSGRAISSAIGKRLSAIGWSEPVIGSGLSC